MKYSIPLIPVTLLRRYKRFLADVELANGEQITVHTPNTGRMLGCAEPGSQLWIRDTASTTRKYRFAWEMSTTADGQLVGVNTHLANQLVREAIETGVVQELGSEWQIRQEVAYGEEGSRIDLLLNNDDGRRVYVEIKNVTASLQARIAHFPDAVSARGTKHLRELQRVVAQGDEAVIFYCVTRSDVEQMQPADEIDPEYNRVLRESLQAGVKALAYVVEISPREIRLTKSIPVVCP